MNKQTSKTDYVKQLILQVFLTSVPSQQMMREHFLNVSKCSSANYYHHPVLSLQ